MTFHTRVEPDVIGYNGFNLYDDNDQYIGDVIFKKTKSGKVKVSINAPSLKAVPKAVDQREDDLYDYIDEDIIES